MIITTIQGGHLTQKICACLCELMWGGLHPKTGVREMVGKVNIIRADNRCMFGTQA